MTTVRLGSTLRRALGLALLLGATATAAAVPATAAQQDAQKPAHLRGEISGVEGRQLSVQTRDGGVAKVELAEKARVLAMAPAKAEAAAPDTVVGAAGTQQAGQQERLKAEMVVVYPEGTKGDMEGYLAWDLQSDTVMRNGMVRSAESGPEGRVVTLYYPQGGATVVIPPDATVVVLEQGSLDLLKKGAHIFVPSAERRQDGSYTAEVVAVGKAGFKPPM